MKPLRASKSVSGIAIRCLFVAAVGVALQFTTAAIASAHTCGDVWCSGSDLSTGKNTQGNRPQIYIGEVGEYNVDFQGESGPCPANPGGACFNTNGATDAATLKQTDNGIGVWFVYLAGGPTARAAPQFGSPYCWGWHQAKQAINDAANRFGTWVQGDQIMFIDIERNGFYGWDGTPRHNRDVFNGFRDYLQGTLSQDPANCSAENTGRKYQHGVYSAPAQWSFSLDSNTNSLSRTPEWTYDDCCNDTWPGDFFVSSTRQARWFGGATDADWRDMWQFNQNPDHDILKEPVDLPFFGHSVGT
jgi:hypothetical protein